MKSVTAAKSAASASPAPPLPSTDTVITVLDSKVLLPGSAAVTRAVLAADASPALDCTPPTAVSASTLRVTAVGAASSSSMVTDPLLPVNPDAAPDTVIVSGPSA